MSGCTDPRLGDLLGAWILGSCAPHEEDEVRGHLGACVSCAEDAAWLAPVRDALLTAPAPAAAPATLKAAVMLEVHAEARLFAQAAGPSPARAARRAEGRTARRFGPRLRWPHGVRGPALVAACSVLLVAGVVALGGLGSERVVTAQVEPSLAPGGSAEMRMAGDGARLEVAGLPDAGPGRRYQVWTSTAGDAPRPTAARFAVDAAGVGAVDIPVTLDRVDRVLVTSEPAAGSRRPTRAPVLSVEL